MSGTSLDGLDICFVTFKKSNYSKYNIINSKTYSYNEKWIEKLKKSIFLNKQELKKIQATPGNRQYITGWGNYDENTVQVMFFEYKTYHNQVFKIKQTDSGLLKALTLTSSVIPLGFNSSPIKRI